MGKIELPGLKSGMPIGFMAALGTFRHATHIRELGKVELAWTPLGGQWCAVLHTAESVEFETFVKLLVERIKGIGDRQEFGWSDAVKNASRGSFISAAGLSLQGASIDDHEVADWFAAFGSELALRDEKVESTPLDMTVSRQRFLGDAKWLTTSLATTGDELTVASFQEALLGPWKYQDDQHSLGWDPTTILLSAFTASSPSTTIKGGVRGAVWLAMESLPFFPCVYDGRLATRAFLRKGNALSFQWPIWAAALSEAAIRTLLSQVQEMTVGEWKARGIAAVYTSDVYKPNKYLTSFRAAVLLG